MFGMGFMEIFLILIVAIMALGPEKLPSAAVDMVKFFRKIKGSVEEAKSTIDSELNLKEMKDEANKFQANFSEIKGIASLDIDDLSNIEDDIKPKKTKSEETKDETSAKTETKSIKENISYNTQGQD